MKSIALLKRDFHSKGGIEKVSLKIIEALQSQGANVTLLTASSTPAPCCVLSCSLKSKIGFKRIQEFDNWCRTQSSAFDVVFSMDQSSFQTHHRAGNGVHAAYLEIRRQKDGFLKSLSLALNPLHHTLLKLEKATFEDPTVRTIIVNSYLVKNQILKFYETPPEKINVIHNGVEWHEMEADFNASFPHRHHPFEFLFVGHNFERKGVLPLLQALSRLKRRDFHLSIVGTDKNLSFYKAQALKLKVPTTFWGAQSNTRPFYQKADVLVAPSLYDPFANVIVEALAMGLFVISSKNNGGHEVLTPFSGLVIDDFTAALEYALDRPKTFSSGLQIRNSIQHLDYSHQMEKVCRCII